MIKAEWKTFRFNKINAMDWFICRGRVTCPDALWKNGLWNPAPTIYRELCRGRRPRRPEGGATLAVARMAVNSSQSCFAFLGNFHMEPASTHFVRCVRFSNCQLCWHRLRLCRIAPLVQRRKIWQHLHQCLIWILVNILIVI